MNVNIKIFLFFIYILSLNILLAEVPGELYIFNSSSQNVIVRVYPVSATFNNDRIGSTSHANYNLVQSDREQLRRPQRDYLNGTSVFIPENPPFTETRQRFFTIPSQGVIMYGFDNWGGSDDGTVGTIGYGIYKVEFFEYCSNPETGSCTPVDYFTIEFDFGYFYHQIGCSTTHEADIMVYFVDETPGNPRIKYVWGSCFECFGTQAVYVPADRKLYERQRGCSGQNWNPVYGDFKYNDGRIPDAPNPYAWIPLDPRVACTRTWFSSQHTTVDQNHVYPGNNHGIITQNLTVEKDIETWHFDQFLYVPNTPADIVIKPNVTFKLASGIGMYVMKYSNGNYCNKIFVEGNAKFWLDDVPPPGTNPTKLWFDAYGFMEVVAAGRLKLGAFSEIRMDHYTTVKLFPNSYVENAGNSRIYIDNGSVLYDCGAITPRPGRLPNIIVKGGNPVGRYIFNPSACNQYEAAEKTFDVGAYLSLDSGTVEIGDSCKFVFDGSDSYLQVGPTSTIMLGDRASIEFKNGAYLNADGCTFVNLGTGDVWSGLKFEDAGASTIQNCTFTGAENYIIHRNTTGASAGGNLTIKNNTFNAGNVSLGNVTNCLVSGNTFADTGTSLNSLEVTNDINLQPDSWSIIITGNTFTGGLYQTKVTGLAGNVMPVYAFDNNFNGSATIGFWADNVSGSFKYNYFSQYDYTKAIDLLNSSMDLYNNTYLSADNANVYLNKSISRLAPVDDGQNRLLWYGGLNKLSTQNANCIYFATDADVFVEKGNNCFTLLDELYYHITGSYTSCQSSEYYSTHNQWNISPQVNVLCGSNPMDNIYDPEITTCPDRPDWELSLVDQYISDIGNGMFDTLFVTSNYGGAGGGMSSEAKPTSGNDKILYAQALLKKRQENHSDAIIACKSIIDSYDTSKFFIAAVDELFMNYQLADTIIGNNTQMTQLKNYLTAKIQQYQNKTAFVDKAYGYYLKALVKLRQYSEAIAGYQNIIANHPDPVVRLSATWERAAIMLLMNGQGGSFSELKANKSRKLLDKNPAHRVSERSYLKSKRSNDYEERSLFTVKQIKQIEAKISLFNPASYKELREKMEGDLKLIAEVSKVEKKPGLSSHIPGRFALRQNYPNPFNPSTEIKYEISKGTYVSIKVYNTLGQLITVLVNNEYKDAGRYSVKFDGTSYASGIYFYSMESKEFTETKKMILLK